MVCSYPECVAVNPRVGFCARAMCFNPTATTLYSFRSSLRIGKQNASDKIKICLLYGSPNLFAQPAIHQTANVIWVIIVRVYVGLDLIDPKAHIDIVKFLSIHRFLG